MTGNYFMQRLLYKKNVRNTLLAVGIGENRCSNSSADAWNTLLQPAVQNEEEFIDFLIQINIDSILISVKV